MTRSRRRNQRRGLSLKTCKLAATHDISYVWVNTCCIDKSSSAELSEAINSMWRYYKDAEVCYAYLSDLPRRANVVEELKACKWFTRGWTLQELIAPKELRFYDETWHFQGTKDHFAQPIHQITKIPPDVLRNPDGLAKFSIAERMTWASKRETTRIEDTAYCLLGIFDINMPLLYGEGKRHLSVFNKRSLRTTMISAYLAGVPKMVKSRFSYLGVIRSGPKPVILTVATNVPTNVPTNVISTASWRHPQRHSPSRVAGMSCSQSSTPSQIAVSRSIEACIRSA